MVGCFHFRPTRAGRLVENPLPSAAAVGWEDTQPLVQRGFLVVEVLAFFEQAKITCCHPLKGGTFNPVFPFALVLQNNKFGGEKPPSFSSPFQGEGLWPRQRGRKAVVGLTLGHRELS